MITLYDLDVSGNCYKVRLLLWMLDLPFERYVVDYREGREHKSEAFLAMNPLGQVPVLTDRGEVGTDPVVLRDSQAILVYLAKRYGTTDWLPDGAEAQAHVTEWLSFAANEIHNGLAFTRALTKFNRPGDIEFHRAIGNRCLALLDGQLADRAWLAGAGPTIADLACYPYVVLSPEGNFDPGTYKNVRAWMDRIEALPRYRPHNA